VRKLAYNWNTKQRGHLTNDMFVEQVSGAVDIFEKKYPGVIGLFIIDNALSHCKKPDDCLNSDRMNVSDGGKQPFMREGHSLGWLRSEDDTGHRRTEGDGGVSWRREG
jgi:hypothetical protein